MENLTIDTRGAEEAPPLYIYSIKQYSACTRQRDGLCPFLWGTCTTLTVENLSLCMAMVVGSPPRDDAQHT